MKTQICLGLISLALISCSPDSGSKGGDPLNPVRPQNIPVSTATVSVSGSINKQLSFSKGAGDLVDCFYVSGPDSLIVEARREVTEANQGTPSEALYISIPRELGLNGTFTLERQVPNQYVSMDLFPEDTMWFARTCTARLQKSGTILDVNLECLNVVDLDKAGQRKIDVKANLACSTEEVDQAEPPTPVTE